MKKLIFGSLFRLFFQIPSRTSGIDFYTIACVFELVDGQTMFLFFQHFFEKPFFRNIFF